MRTTLLLLLFALLSTCQTEQPASDQQTTASIQPNHPTITDSIRQLYHTYITQLEQQLPPQCIPERGKINPADEAPKDTLFFVFREGLKKIIADRDIFGLLPHVHQDIKTSFGTENGLQSFIQMWELDSPEKISQSRLWPTLASLLNLGGTFQNDGKNTYFEAPYLGPCWPNDAKPYEYGAVTGAGVRLRSGPSLTAKILKNLSFDLVKYIETTPIEETISSKTHPWIKIQLQDGTEGFLFGKFYRSPLDFRARFQTTKEGQWKLVSLLTGD